MGRGARRSMVGLVVGTGVLLAAVAVASPMASGAASAKLPAAVVVDGAVEADGSAVVGDGWSVERLEAGRYVVRSPASRMDLDVETWDAPAEVASVPIGDGAVEVSFRQDATPVDVRFTWRARLDA